MPYATLLRISVLPDRLQVQVTSPLGSTDAPTFALVSGPEAHGAATRRRIHGRSAFGVLRFAAICSFGSYLEPGQSVSFQRRLLCVW